MVYQFLPTLVLFSSVCFSFHCSHSSRSIATMASNTPAAWKSPLSILMGARRNDDADLQLRDDYFTPVSSAIPPSPMTRANSPPPEPATAQENATTRSGLASYLPFGYFSSKPSDQTRNTSLDNGNASYAPPRVAFPPPISEHDNSGIIRGELFAQEQREDGGGDGGNQEYVPSHPWYNQHTLTDDNHEQDNNTNSSNPHLEHQTTHNMLGKKRGISWPDQKAIMGTTFNFTNSIIGAGAMGLGGAFAASGGGISILCLVGFAYLTKLSLDLIVDLISSPDVIQKARAGEFVYEDLNEEEQDADRSSYYESSRFNRKCEDKHSTVHEDNQTSIVQQQSEDDAANQSQSVNDGATNEDGREHESTTKEAYIDEQPQPDEGVATDESAKQVDDRESSPLIAKDGQDDPMQSIDHPLALTERYDSLNGGATQPRHFLSPLDLNSDGIPIPNLKPTTAQKDSETQQPPEPCTYEELGHAAFGSIGRLAVLLSKAMYSFGCLIAYVVVVRDNFGLAIRRIALRPESGPALLFTAMAESSSDATDTEDEGAAWLYDDGYLAFLVSATIMLPLSCPRTMKPLAKFSFISVLSIVFLVLAVVYLYFTCTNPVFDGGDEQSSFYENWIEIKSVTGFLQSLGTFVFTFTCHHTVNLAYESLPSSIRCPKIWKRVSTNSIVMATETSLVIGIFAYMTFGANTPADVLMGYPPDLNLANVARLLLCLTMVLTFPLPFLTCREMTVLIMVDAHRFYYVHGLQRYNFFRPVVGCLRILRRKLWTCIFRKEPKQGGFKVETEVDAGADEEEVFVEMQRPSLLRKPYFSWIWRPWKTTDDNDEWWDNRQLTQTLLPADEEPEIGIVSSIGGLKGEAVMPSPLSSPNSSSSGDTSSYESTVVSVHVPTPKWILGGGNGRQLTVIWHAVLTFVLWGLITICAVKSPSLGDVLDLVGSFNGTLMAFVLPALFAFRLKGYSLKAFAILSVGGFVGLCGTLSSLVKLSNDMSS